MVAADPPELGAGVVVVAGGSFGDPPELGGGVVVVAGGSFGDPPELGGGVVVAAAPDGIHLIEVSVNPR